MTRLEKAIVEKKEHIQDLLKKEKNDLMKEELIDISLFFLNKNNFDQFIEYYQLAFTK